MPEAQALVLNSLISNQGAEAVKQDGPGEGFTD